MKWHASFDVLFLNFQYLKRMFSSGVQVVWEWKGMKVGWEIGVIPASKDKKERLVTKEVQVKPVSIQLE